MIIKLYCACFGCGGTRKTKTDMRTGRMVPQTRCEKCGGRGQIPDGSGGKDPAWIGCPLCNEVDANGMVPLILKAGSDCPLCTDGYCEVGMTQGQVDRIRNERDSLLSFAAEVADCVTRQKAEELAERAGALVAGRGAEIAEHRRKVADKQQADANRAAASSGDRGAAS